MTTQNVKENLNSNEFVKFSFRDFKTKMDKGIEKKDFTPPEGWSNLTKSSLNQEHTNIGILTGNINNLTVLDYDDKKVFIEDNLKFKFFENNYYIVETKNGYHIYFNYVNIDSCLNVGFKKIDFLNNGRFVIAPPTRYNLLDGTLITYKLRKGSIKKDMPQDLINYIQGLIDIKKGIIKPIEEPNMGFGIIPVENKPSKYNISTEEYLPYMNELLDCLSVARADNRDEWIRVGMLLKKLGCDSGLYHNFSSKSSKYEQKNCDDTWKSLKSENSINIGTLITFANTDDPSRLNDIRKMIYEKRINKKVKKNEVKDEVKDEVKADEKADEIVFCSSDEEASMYIFNILKSRLKSYKGRLFFLKNNIWITNQDKIKDELLYFIQKSKIYLTNDKNKLIAYAQQITKANNILASLINSIKIENEDLHLYDKFHTTTCGKVCFEDGVLDFKKRNFYYWTDEEYFKKNPIYSTIKINREYGEYFKKPDKIDIDDVKKSIFETAYGNDTTTALNFLSRALNGHSIDKRWATYHGSRNSGKGVEYKILKKAFEDYVSTFELGNLLFNKKTEGLENLDCSKKLYWLLDLEFVRLAVNQEIPADNSDLYLNSKMFKKITGGDDTIVARRNYDRFDTHINIDTTFYIKGNSSIKVSEADCNQTRLEFQSVVKFVSNDEYNLMIEEKRDEKEMKRFKIADNDIKNKCANENWMNACVYLIYENYINDKVEINVEPEKYEVSELFNCINTNFEITDDKKDILLIDTVYDLIMTKINTKKKDIEAELNSMNVFKVKPTAGDYKNKRVFTSIKIKEYNNKAVAECKN